MLPWKYYLCNSNATGSLRLLCIPLDLIRSRLWQETEKYPSSVTSQRESQEKIDINIKSVLNPSTFLTYLLSLSIWLQLQRHPFLTITSMF